jgi:leucyl aminopeptidase
MTRSPNKLIPAGFRTVPGLDALDAALVTVGPPAADAQALGVGVTTDGTVPAELGFDRTASPTPASRRRPDPSSLPQAPSAPTSSPWTRSRCPG